MTEEPEAAFQLCRFLEPQQIFQGELNRLQRRLLAFYLGEQARRAAGREENEFKTLFYALVHRDNHDLYKEIFKSEEEREWDDLEQEYGYETPQSEADLARMYREMRRTGLLQYSDGSPAVPQPSSR